MYIPQQVLDTAYSWHGGGSSPLYRFASNRRIDNEGHRKSLIGEVELCIAQNDFYASEKEAEGRKHNNERSQLLALLKFIQEAPVVNP